MPDAQAQHAAARRVAQPADVDDSLSPISSDDFGFNEARALLLRAGFGGTTEQVQTLASWGPERAVGHLVEYDDVPVEPVRSDEFAGDIMVPLSRQQRLEYAQARRNQDEETLARFREARQERQRRDRRQARDLRAWWLGRMIESPRPLEEKMTLFWHGHFATGYRTIENSYHMFLQNQLFRKHATGNFGQLLHSIIRDPAMIAYLDNNDSRRGRPNENLAREILELFSLGVGNYSERDIKEGARALTGYTFQGNEFYLNTRNHDSGQKRILGASGDLDGDDFVKAILAQRACTAFIADKLYRYFVAEAPENTPGLDRAAPRFIRRMAGVLAQNKYELRPLLRRVFMSRHFYQACALEHRIKSPIELVVGAIRSYNAPPRDLAGLADAMGLMGQSLFQPPSVAGWPGGRTWINASTLFVRKNAMAFLLTGKTTNGYHPSARRDPFDPMPLLEPLAQAEPAAARDASKVADYLLRFSLGRSTDSTRAPLMEFASQHNGQVSPPFVTGLLLLITAMPEYQLC